MQQNYHIACTVKPWHYVELWSSLRTDESKKKTGHNDGDNRSERHFSFANRTGELVTIQWEGTLPEDEYVFTIGGELTEEPGFFATLRSVAK